VTEPAFLEKYSYEFVLIRKEPVDYVKELVAYKTSLRTRGL